MSNVLGIVAEYNPFHNGHLYHLEKSKKDTGSDYSIAVISGNFTQRGSTSLVDKWEKTQMAISNGVDLVIELPTIYATSSAENFADGAIKILDSLKIVDYVSFGAETPNLSALDHLAEILYYEPKEYKALLSIELGKGLSFPKARENALMMYLNDQKNIRSILNSPNNILAIEYLKSLKKHKSKINPYIIGRFESDYNSKSYTNNIASSTAIRNMLKNNAYNVLPRLMPQSSCAILAKNIKTGHAIPDISVFEKEIIYNLRKMTVNEIRELPDVSEGLEFAIKEASSSCNTIVEFLNIIKSKRYTSTRLQRILLYSLLGITKKDVEVSKKTTPYIRVLGFNQNGKYLLSEISKANPKLQIITSVKKFVDSNNKNRNLDILFSKDIWATNVYTIGYNNDSWSNLDFTHKLIMM
ncbi:MAG: nucleotidyltransferase [Clostridia bacterium]|nr:nucleotidyltransferase [Clostridia bacterium]